MKFHMTNGLLRTTDLVTGRVLLELNQLRSKQALVVMKVKVKVKVKLLATECTLLSKGLHFG